MPCGVMRCHLGTLPAVPSDEEVEQRNGPGSHPLNGGQVSVNQIPWRPVVQIEGTPDHDGVAAKGHLLDCCINKTFPTMPPDTQLTITAVECKMQ